MKDRPRFFIKCPLLGPGEDPMETPGTILENTYISEAFPELIFQARLTIKKPPVLKKS